MIKEWRRVEDARPFYHMTNDSNAKVHEENGAKVREENGSLVRKETGGRNRERTNVGGQAIIEGLMMIGPDHSAIAVRKPNKEIELQIKPIKAKTAAQKIPFLRGVVNLFRQMKIGIKALMYSAEFFDIEDEEEPAKEETPSKFEQFLERKFGDKATEIAITFAVILSLFFSVGLFILLPNLLVSFLGFDKTIGKQLLASNLCEGVLRITIFLCYMALTSRLKEISRVWQYHGAEHKTINCYEHNEELIVENVRKHSTKHPRCGTSFLFLVMIISILVFSTTDLIILQLPFEVVGITKVLVSLLTRVIMIPFVAGISYEIIKLAGQYENLCTRIISAPGLMFQRFSTREPDDDMLEVAIVAFNGALTGVAPAWYNADASTEGDPDKGADIANAATESAATNEGTNAVAANEGTETVAANTAAGAVNTANANILYIAMKTD